MTLPVLMLLASIGLRGQTACPTVEQVSARLDGLDQDGDGPMRWVELRAEADHLQLSLWSPDGAVEAVRELPLPASCDALAKASAVTIATWALRPAPLPELAPAVKAPRERRIFDREILDAERLRLAHILETTVLPQRVLLRGPLATMGAGLVASVVGPMFASGAGFDSPRMIGSVFLFAAGVTAFTSGMFWLITTLGSATHDAQIVF